MVLDYGLDTILTRPTEDAAKSFVLRTGGAGLLQPVRSEGPMLDRHGKLVRMWLGGGGGYGGGGGGGGGEDVCVVLCNT